MAPTGAKVREAPRKRSRSLGRVSSENAGPTLIVMSGMHGNEPASVSAAERVLARFRDGLGLACGDFVVLVGNVAALRRKTRFVDQDLNRAWTVESVRRVREGIPDLDRNSEHDEMLEVLAEIESVVENSRGMVHFLDLHTYSAAGAPFVTVGDTLRNRKFALQFPLPLILGLEEQVDGALLEFLNNVGAVTMGMEAGQHEHPSSVDRHEALLWLALAAVGLVDEGDVPDLRGSRDLLERASLDVPRVIEVRHRHAIEDDDGFRMEPGFVNFQPIRKGELIARDKHGPILATEDGLMLLPLYQGKGNDGFFIAREVRRFWLRVSTVLRRLRLGALLRWLPGIRRDSVDRDIVWVNTSVARVYPLEVFHLFGFRKLRRSGSELIVGRRKFDLRPPRRIDLRTPGKS